ncbi:MAG: ATP-dependent zinc metalloprotease FtsH [bacterium]
MDNDIDNSNENNLDNNNSNSNNNNSNSDKNNKNKNNTPINILFIAISITLLFNIISIFMEAKTIKEIDYNEFLDMLEEGQIERVELHSGKIMIYSADETQASDTSIWEASSTQEVLYTGRFPDADLKSDLRKYDVEFTTPIIENNALLDFFLTYFLPVLLTYAILTLFFRNMSGKMGGGMFGMGKSNAKAYVQKETGVTFKDVAGQEEAKESLKEIVDFLNNPEKYTEIGAVQPKGALLVGPPGTGKTMLAKAVAGEANVTFLSIAGSDFVEMYVGLGASRVRSLYKQATENAPCIVFIDEIDAIGKKRDNNGGNDEREQTLNQLLAEMDGFDSSKGIVLLAATNRPEVLDKALLRPGRFDRRIIVERPDLKGREDILNVHAKKVKLDENVDLNKIALATSGSVGADLANMVNEAALRAVRHKRERVKQEDLMEAVEVVIAGKEKKDRILSEQERKIVAYHEVGHALVAAMLKNTKPVQKITIVPRTMGSLGYTLQIPEEDKHLQSNIEMLEEIMVLLGGRCAEEVEFNSVTTGASNDIKRATSIARSMITLYGMSERFDMVGLEDVENRYLDGRMVTNCSERMQYEIDQEILKLIKECHEKARKILEDNREALDKISDFLIQKENITGEEFMGILKEIEDNKSKEDIDDTIDDMYDAKESLIEDDIELKEDVIIEEDKEDVIIEDVIIEEKVEMQEDILEDDINKED